MLYNLDPVFKNYGKVILVSQIIFLLRLLYILSTYFLLDIYFMCCIYEFYHTSIFQLFGHIETCVWHVSTAKGTYDIDLILITMLFLDCMMLFWDRKMSVPDF